MTSILLQKSLSDDLTKLSCQLLAAASVASQVWKLFRGQKVWRISLHLFLHTAQSPPHVTCFPFVLWERESCGGWCRQGDSAMCYDWTQSVRTFVSMPPVQRQGARACCLARPVREIVDKLLALSEWLFQNIHRNWKYSTSSALL